MGFADREVLCVDCGVMFPFSTGEEQFFQEKGFSHVPKHCKLCKAKRHGDLEVVFVDGKVSEFHSF